MSARVGARRRAIVAGVAGLVVGGAFGPPLAAVAAEKLQEVVVANTAENAVPTKAVGTTDVRGTVTLAEGITINGTAGDKPLPVTPTGTTQVAGAVGLTEGAKVLIDRPVQLADNTRVSIGNADDDPVPVKVLGGGGGGSPATQTPVSFRATVFVSAFRPSQYGPSYTVPAGKTFVITAAYGLAEDAVTRVALERRDCAGAGSGLYQYGTISGPANGKVWTMHGESRATSGCELVPVVLHEPVSTDDSQATFHVYGYLIDE